MADGYLEKHQQEYEVRKTQWMLKKKHQPRQKSRTIGRPEDEAL